MICGVRLNEGAQRCEPTSLSWRRGGNTWGITQPCHLKPGLKRSQTDQLGGIKADVGIIKAPSGQGKIELKGGRGVCSGISALVPILRRLRGNMVLVVIEGGMEGKNSLSREGNHGGCLSRRLGGERGDGSSRADDVDVRMNGRVDEDPGERWFH